MSTLLTERSRQAAAAAAALLACLLVSACGSQLDPEDVARTEGRSGAVAADQAGVGAAAGDPQATGAVPGDGTVPGTDGGGAAGGAGGSGGTGGGGGAGTGGGGGAGDAPSEVPKENAPVGNGPKGACGGFKNQTGITDKTITIANASDVSGPVPGLFLSARQATQAFVAYYNATESLCGRKLKVLELDSKADAAADQQAYAQACDQAFAAVGSVSSFDAGGAATAAGCGLPDVRSFTVTPQRQSCRTCYAAYSINSNRIAASLPKYWLQKQPEASKHVGVFYIDVAAAKTNAQSFSKAFEKAGMNVDVVQGIGVQEFNYTPYVETMKRQGIQFVQYFGPYQYAIKLQKAMQQQSFTPKVYLEDPTIYDANYIQQAGDAGDGSYVYSANDLFTAPTTEMKLYISYLNQVAPGAEPNYYGLYAWSATRLFVEQATALGGRLDRGTLVAALGKVKGWTGNGLHAPMPVGAKDTSPCIKIIQRTGSSWKQVSPGSYLCGGLIQV